MHFGRSETSMFPLQGSFLNLRGLLNSAETDSKEKAASSFLMSSAIHNQRTSLQSRRPPSQNFSCQNPALLQQKQPPLTAVFCLASLANLFCGLPRARRKCTSGNAFFGRPLRVQQTQATSASSNRSRDNNDMGREGNRLPSSDLRQAASNRSYRRTKQWLT